VPAECTYLGENDATNDALPMNCISRAKASLACIALDKELLTEIDWELAASNGGRGTRFPWGEDTPTCDRAVLSVDGTCVRKGPVAGGSDNDVNALGLRNLGGNLSEWVADIFVPYTDACWGDLLDTSGCSTDTRFIGWKGPWPHRGGSWKRRASSAASFARFASPNGAPSPEIGFRCKTSVPL
jgi:formylglycine-generating enzyme required for sulfatase activity